MKKFMVIFSGVLYSTVCMAQENIENFYSGLVSDDTVAATESNGSPMTARKVFEMKPQLEKVPDIKAPKIKHEEDDDNVAVAKKAGIEHEAAPFGLYWGLSMKETEEAGVDLKEFKKKDEVNVYEATNLPKPIKDFEVIVSFGETNELWKINAYLATEDPAGEYKKYYQFLEKKYGEAQDEGDYDKVSGENGASTFTQGNMAVRLSTGIAPDQAKFLHIEYINKQMIKAKEDDIIDAL